MLDIALIRDNPEAVLDSLTRRGDTATLDGVTRHDKERRELIQQVEDLRAKRNVASKEIGEAKRRGEDAESEMAAVRALGDDLEKLEDSLREVEERLQNELMQLPNTVQDDVPTGGEEDAVEVKQVGDKPSFAFEVRDHLDIGTDLGLIDMERGARTSGSRFAYLLGDAVLLQYALVQYAMGVLTREGHTPVVPPVLVREEAMWGTGFFPTDRNQIYQTHDDLYLVGTSEVPLAAYHSDEILDLEALPLRYAGVSSCFRREAGAGGKDERGIFRVHQFDKVEMFSFVTPDKSVEEHDRLLALEEEIISGLDLHYRVVNIAAGDLGASAAKKYDIEVWLPGQGQYRELTSCSNCTDYQARRLQARFRPEGEKKTQFVHTLNGTAVAIGRMIVALLENGQQEDGSVVIPEVLAAHGAPRTIEPALQKV